MERLECMVKKLDAETSPLKYHGYVSVKVKEATRHAVTNVVKATEAAIPCIKEAAIIPNPISYVAPQPDLDRPHSEPPSIVAPVRDVEVQTHEMSTQTEPQSAPEDSKKRRRRRTAEAAESAREHHALETAESEDMRASLDEDKKKAILYEQLWRKAMADKQTLSHRLVDLESRLEMMRPVW